MNKIFREACLCRASVEIYEKSLGGVSMDEPQSFRELSVCVKTWLRTLTRLPYVKGYSKV